MHHLIDKTHGLQVLRRHDVFIINVELIARLVIRSGIRTTTHLDTLAPISRAVGGMQTHITLATDSHTKGAMTEHLDTDLLTAGTTDMFLFNLTIDLSHLIHIQFTCQHHHIGKLGIELQRLDIRDIQLGGEMHLLSHPITIGHHSNIRGNDSRDSSSLRSIDNLMHQRNILAIDNRVHREVALDTMLIAGLGNLTQIINSEGRC